MQNLILEIIPKAVTKVELQRSADIMVENILEVQNSITGYVMFHALESSIKLAKEAIKEIAITTFQGKEMIILGARVTLIGGKKEWDYHNDPDLKRFEREKEELDKRIKARKTYLQTLEKEVVGIGAEVLAERAFLLSDGGLVPRISYPKGE